jgi:hypothetical protein
VISQPKFTGTESGGTTSFCKVATTFDEEFYGHYIKHPDSNSVSLKAILPFCGQNFGKFGPGIPYLLPWNVFAQLRTL